MYVLVYRLSKRLHAFITSINPSSLPKEKIGRYLGLYRYGLLAESCLGLPPW